MGAVTFTNVKGMAFFSNIVIVIIVSAVAAFLLSQAYGVAAGNKRIKYALCTWHAEGCG